MKMSVDCDIRMSLDKVSSKMRRNYSESLRELNLYVGQDNLLTRLWLDEFNIILNYAGTFYLIKVVVQLMKFQKLVL